MSYRVSRKSSFQITDFKSLIEHMFISRHNSWNSVCSILSSCAWYSLVFPDFVNLLPSNLYIDIIGISLETTITRQRRSTMIYQHAISWHVGKDLRRCIIACWCHSSFLFLRNSYTSYSFLFACFFVWFQPYHTHTHTYIYIYIYYVAMVTAGIHNAYTPHQYST